MREWRVCRQKHLHCRSCSVVIPEGKPMLAITIPGTYQRFRCQGCARAMFEEDPPEVIPEPVPAPSGAVQMEVDRHRKPDFVTPRQLARSMIDLKQRQTGERE